MTLDEIRKLAEDDLHAVDGVIRARLKSAVPLVDQVAEHIIAGGGKRLRPLLVVLAARACGHSGSAHVEAAAFIEFIHTATLLHDDVVDGSALRRGRHTANQVFGNPASKFGNPVTSAGPPYGGRAIDLCKDGDPICSRGRNPFAHNGYETSDFIPQAAGFTAALV